MKEAWGASEGLWLTKPRTQIPSSPAGQAPHFTKPFPLGGARGSEPEWLQVSKCESNSRVGAGWAAGAASALPAPRTFQLAAYLEQMQYLVPCERGCPSTCCYCPSPGMLRAILRVLRCLT